MRLRRVVAAAFTAFAVIAVPTAASAADHPAPRVTIPQRERGATAARLERFLEVQKIPDSKREALVEKVRNGVRPDSATDAVPVSITTAEVNGNIETRSTFADGSVSVALLQNAPGEFDGSSVGVTAADALSSEAVPAESNIAAATSVSFHVARAGHANAKRSKAFNAAGASLRSAAPKGSGVKDCSVSTGSGYAVYSNCLAWGGNGIQAMGFSITYQIIAGTYNDSILNHWGPLQQCVGAVCDVPYAATIRLKETSSYKASVSYYMKYTVLELGSSTASLVVNVGGNATSVSFKGSV